ncbi:alkaline shock response membrane anchor protein AmaP [Paenibacillus thermoaerophilus]|uniref:Alkaline shock response membrane anchor protein AmaP n=1 Tax=Paenibacillus thermoaerophilus TaxID=1215385 RepID=A0ABW2V5P4_9BACL|nr:alkaline shock response membrane anchor protein AmaP [Paenibacillus thermoaerophilus]TMV18783.1 alkaline shock response membrane anchor protein AmaP [Paenibacillus thermoaerophilus]
MAKVFDKLLLFFYSLIAGAAALFALILSFAWIPLDDVYAWTRNLYTDAAVMAPTVTVSLLMLLATFRFLYLTLRSGRGQAPSIDQRTDVGDIRISLDTVENLALKAASRQRGLKDLKARISVSESGIDIVIRTLVDGETSIPELTEETQRAVKQHVEDITGIPVSSVGVYVANVVPSQTFRSRVE